ncbi:MAG: type VI secretion system contractile sheath large subunit [Bacteroidota bacterium]
MSDSSSVGFQITSDPDTTTVQASSGGTTVRERGGAFRLLLVADLDPQAHVEDWSEGTRTWDVDANSFADRMREHGPQLEVSVPDRLGGAVDGRRQIAWQVDALDGFSPAGIVSRVPALTAIAQAHTALDDARSGSLTLDALRERLRETGLDAADGLAESVRLRPPSASPRPPDDDGSLDALLGMVALEGEEASPPSDALSALIVASQEPTGDVDREAAARVADRLADRLRAQISEIVEHPDVRRAEAAWRGLKMLVGRLAFRKGAALTVLASPKAPLAEAVHYQVLLPEYDDGLKRVPLAAVIIDHDVEPSSADLNTLGDLAASGASLQVPMVLSVSPAFFGLATPTDFSRLPPATAHLQKPEYAAFRSLRTRAEANQLVLAIPPFVLRHAYGPDHPDKAHGVEGGERLWGGSALLVGAAMAEAHNERGWPTASAGQAVGDLHVRNTRMGAMPLSASFSDSVLDDLARAGILGFSGPLRTDRAVMGPPATTANPADASADARARATLPASIASALATHRALTIGPECAGMDTETAIAEIDRRFRAFLRKDSGPVDEDVVTVQHLEEHEAETSNTYGVRLRPPRSVLPHTVGIVFGVDVPKSAPADGA